MGCILSGMYALASSFTGQPVISIQTGQPIATLVRPLLSVSNLEMVALLCDAPKQREYKLLLPRDIRQIATDCIVVDDADNLTDPEDVVRLREVVAQNLIPTGMNVVTQSGQRVGKIEDYTINLQSGLMQKLYVHQTMMRSLLYSNLLIDRTQIVEVSPQRFVVSDTGVKSGGLFGAAPKPAK